MISDIDECARFPRPCGHTCTNTQGSYECSCPQGYNLLHNGRCRGQFQARLWV